MKRPVPEPIEASGQDSFLDVVTNIVGILIILVMVVGMRAEKHPPPKAQIVAASTAGPPPVAPSAPQAPAPEQIMESGLKSDVRNMARDVSEVQQETSLRFSEREQLATLVAAGQLAIQQQRGKLDAESQANFDLQRALAEARATLDDRERERIGVEMSGPPPVEVQSYTTPISRMVIGHEIHFQISGGRVAYVPVHELFDKAKSSMRDKNWKLEDIGETAETAGPVSGFRLIYTVEIKQDDRGQAVLQSKEWKAVPINDHIGEPLNLALADHSNFRLALAPLDPRTSTVTFWVYPDSFAEFRAMKLEMHRLGYATAGRPLPPGKYIAGSAHGSKSAAE